MMGMGTVDLEAVLEFRAKGWVGDNARIVELGSQQISADVIHNQLLMDRIRDAFGRVPVIPQGERPLSIRFWQSLGFEYLSVDIEGENILPLDLNFDRVPLHLRNRYHLATNFGTTEHVVNQLNAFKILHDLVGPGCIMLHNVPSAGFLDHGLVNYTPKFFWRLARANGYRVTAFRYIGNPTEKQRIPAPIRDYFKSLDAEFEAKEPQMAYSNMSLLVGLQKQFDIDFVPPIDLADDAEAPTEEIRDRYWTEFDENPWQQARKGVGREKLNIVLATYVFARRLAAAAYRRLRR
jgi:hypothetical protein